MASRTVGQSPGVSAFSSRDAPQAEGSARAPHDRQRRPLTIQKPARIKPLALLVIVPILYLACGDDEDRADGTPGNVATSQPAEGAESQLCGDLDALELALRDVQALSTTSTLEELDEVGDAVDVAFDDVQESARESQEARIESAAQGIDNLRMAIAAAAGGDTTVGAAFGAIQSQATAALQAFWEVDQQLACP